MRKVEVIVYVDDDITDDQFEEVRNNLERSCWMAVGGVQHGLAVLVQANEI